MRVHTAYTMKIVLLLDRWSFELFDENAQTGPHRFMSVKMKCKASDMIESRHVDNFPNQSCIHYV
jgi:hypothetical protein